MGLSQTALGVKMWPETPTSNASTRIKRFENGQKPKVHELNLLAKALDLDVAELLAAEYGEGWSKEIVDGGLVVHKRTLEKYPTLGGMLEVLNTCCINELNEEIAKQTLRSIGNLADEKSTEGTKVPKKSKA